MNKEQKFEMASGAMTFVLGLLMPMRWLQLAGWDMFNRPDWYFFVVPPLAISFLVFLAAITDCYLTHVLTFLLLSVLSVLLVCIDSFFGFFFFVWGSPIAAALVFCPVAGAILTVIRAHR